jgi:hypothetical protein
LKFELFTGTCEQFKYDLKSKTLRSALKEIRSKLKIQRLWKTATPIDYPKGSMHFRYRANLCKKINSKLLLIGWEND